MTLVLFVDVLPDSLNTAAGVVKVNLPLKREFARFCLKILVYIDRFHAIVASDGDLFLLIEQL